MAEELKKPRQTTKSKPGKAEWDTAAVEIFINIYYQGSNIKGLNDAVRVALQVEGYGISLKQISGKKRTKGFQFAAQARHNSKEKVERGDAPKRAGETVQSTPGSNPSRQETLSEDERLDGPTVEQLLCSLENARNESEAGFATLCQTMQNAGKEDEASNQAYEAQEALLEEYISPGPQAQTKGAKIPRYQKETKVCKPKERAKTEKDTRPCNKSGSTKRVWSSKS